MAGALSQMLSLNVFPAWVVSSGVAMWREGKVARRAGGVADQRLSPTLNWTAIADVRVVREVACD